MGTGFGVLILTTAYAIMTGNSPTNIVFLLGVFCVVGSMSVHLARSIARTSTDLEIQLARVQDLSEKALEQERALVQQMERELQTAHDMQMGLMPESNPLVSGLDIAGRCVPADHVGGDFFQYFDRGRELAVCVADAAGHAMGAAIPVVMFDGILKSEMAHGGSVEEVFGRLNRSLHATLESRTFVCFTMAVLDPEARMARLSNGGCPYPYHWRAAEGRLSEVRVGAYPLGVRADTTYAAAEVELGAGDRLVFCSDGIVEATCGGEEQFGYERTADAIVRACAEDVGAEGTIDRLLGAAEAFRGGTPQSDDMVCVVVRVT